MNTKTILIALAALAIGIIGGYALNNSAPEHAMPDGSTMHGAQHTDMQSEMDGMMKSLEGKTGDAFDKAFLSEMIVHHQGAVAMAEAALQNAGHEEIKSMATAIITAQNGEIAQMQAWLKAWYGE